MWMAPRCLTNREFAGTISVFSTQILSALTLVGNVFANMAEAFCSISGELLVLSLI